MSLFTGISENWARIESQPFYYEPECSRQLGSRMPEVELCPGRWVGDNHPVFVIAELGQNHQVINHVFEVFGSQQRES